MPSALLNVPHFSQSTDGRCLEACVCMCLAFLGDAVVEEQVTRLFGSTGGGTLASRVVRVNSWGYEVTYRPGNFEELVAWLENGKVPIALVKTQFLDYWHWSVNTPHAVVVVGTEGQEIYLNDPAFDAAPQVCSLDGFLAAWAEMDERIALIEQS